MSRSAAVTSRPRRRAAPPPEARSLGLAVEHGFRQAAAQAVAEAHQADVPIAILTDAGEVAWLHPDGIVRPTRSPVHRSDTP